MTSYHIGFILLIYMTQSIHSIEVSGLKVFDAVEGHDFNLVCFDELVDKNYRTTWYVGNGDIGNLKLASEVDLDTNEKGQLDFQNMKTKTLKHNLFTCTLSYKDPVSWKIPITRTVFIRLAKQKRCKRHTRNLNEAVYIKFMTKWTSVNDVSAKFVNTDSDINYHTLMEYGIPIFDESVSNVNKSIQQKLSEFCSINSCEILDYELSIVADYCISQKKKFNFIKSCLRHVDHFWGSRYPGLMAHCEDKCSQEDCIGIHLNKVPRCSAKENYPNINKFISPIFYVKFEIPHQEVQEILRDFNWDISQSSQYIMQRTPYFVSQQYRHNFVYLSPTICFDEFPSDIPYISSTIVISNKGSFTISLTSHALYQDIEIKAALDHEDIFQLSIQPSMNRINIKINDNHECTLEISHLLENIKNVTVIVTLTSHTDGMILNIQYFKVNYKPVDTGTRCTLDNTFFNTPEVTIDRIEVITSSTQPIYNFKIYKTNLDPSIIPFHRFNLQCTNHTLAYGFQELMNRITNANETDLQTLKCPRNCIPNQPCSLCVTNERTICEDIAIRDCIPGRMCQDHLIEVGLVFIKDPANNKILICPEETLHRIPRSSEEEPQPDVLEIKKIQILPVMSLFEPSIPLKTAAFKQTPEIDPDANQKCLPGYFKAATDKCRLCPQDYFSDSTDPESFCFPCPLLKPYSRGLSRTSLDCTNSRLQKILSAAILNNASESYELNLSLPFTGDDILKKAGLLEETLEKEAQTMKDDVQVSIDDVKILQNRVTLKINDSDIRLLIFIGLCMALISVLVLGLIAICVFSLAWASVVRGIKRTTKLMGNYLKYRLIHVKTKIYEFKLKKKQFDGYCNAMKNSIMGKIEKMFIKIKLNLKGVDIRFRKTIGYYFFWDLPKKKTKSSKKKVKEDDEPKSEEDDESEDDDEDESESQ